MLNVSRYNTSGFKSISQLSLSSGNLDDAPFKFSALRASFAYKQICPIQTSKKHNASLPINQIPIELLCDIFSKFLEDDRRLPDYTPAAGPLVSFYSRADPTILGQVCSWWRRVALSTPTLWTGISILEPRTSQLYRTRLWLERAGTYPLDLAIQEKRKEGEFELGPLREIVSLFILHSESWRKIEFSLPHVAHYCLASIRANECLILESASVHISLPYRAQPLDLASSRSYANDMWKALHSSPKLCHVNWWSAYREEMPTHAPWKQLTHLNLHSEFSVKQLIDILSLCHRLQETSIYRLSLAPSLERCTDQEPLVLEFLHTLTLESTVDSGSLFKSLTLPSLRSLTIRHRQLEETVSRDFDALHTCLTRSNCSLTRFTFFDHSLPEETLAAYLAPPCLRNISFLEVQGVITDKIIECLTRQNVDGYHQLMPFLQEMKLCKCVTRDGLLGQMASSRWWTNINNLNGH